AVVAALFKKDVFGAARVGADAPQTDRRIVGDVDEFALRNLDAERSARHVEADLLEAIARIGLDIGDQKKVEHHEQDEQEIDRSQEPRDRGAARIQRVELARQGKVPEGEKNADKSAERQGQAEIVRHQIGEH